MKPHKSLLKNTVYVIGAEQFSRVINFLQVAARGVVAHQLVGRFLDLPLQLLFFSRELLLHPVRKELYFGKTCRVDPVLKEEECLF